MMELDWLKLKAFIDGAATPEEKEEVEKWLDEDPGHLKLYENFLNYYAGDAGKRVEFSEEEINAKYGKLTRLKMKRDYRRIRRIVAAAVLLPASVLAGAWLYMNNSADNADPIVRIVDKVTLVMPDGTEIILDQSAENSRIAEQNNVAITRNGDVLVAERISNGASNPVEQKWGKIEVPKGAQFSMILEDGTHVWLNADSRLRFPVPFTGSERRVYLEGEGYFEVKRNEAMPFIVETAEQTLAVLGTEFNIYAYPDEAKVRTTLVNGSVGITIKETNTHEILLPGQQLQIDNLEKSYSIGTANIAKVSSWRNMMFVFDGDTFEEIFAKLARWYDLKYEFEDDQVAKLTLRGSIPIYDSISTVIELIESSGLTTIEKDKNLIRIKMKK